MAKKIKKAVKSAVDSVLRGLQKLIGPIKKIIDKVLDFVRAPFQVLGRLIKAIPRLIRPDLPNLGRMVRAIIDGVRIIFKGIFSSIGIMFGLIRDSFRLTIEWLKEAFPFSSWQKIDNAIGALWIPLTLAQDEVIRWFFPDIANRVMPMPTADSFRGTVGAFHGFRLGHYIFRIVGPFASGVIAAALVGPEWFFRSIRLIPKYLVRFIKLAFQRFMAAAEAILRGVWDGISHIASTWWAELMRPIRYYRDEIKRILEPLTSLF